MQPQFNMALTVAQPELKNILHQSKTKALNTPNIPICTSLVDYTGPCWHEIAYFPMRWIGQIIHVVLNSIHVPSERQERRSLPS